MISNPMLSRLSEQEYLQGELTSEIRREYVDGEVYVMAVTVVSQDEPLLLESVGASLTLDEIYEGVRLDA